MSFLRTRLRLVLVAGSCLAIGAGASAIASAGATTTAGTAATAGAHAKVHPNRHGLMHRAVHGDLVVATKTGFKTVTFDRGLVKAVNGQQLTLQEGTKKATYKTVTLTIPANARVRDDHQQTTLANVKPGQRASVVQLPKRTIVVAHTPRTG